MQHISEFNPWYTPNHIIIPPQRSIFPPLRLFHTTNVLRSVAIFARRLFGGCQSSHRWPVYIAGQAHGLHKAASTRPPLCHQSLTASNAGSFSEEWLS